MRSRCWSSDRRPREWSAWTVAPATGRNRIWSVDRAGRDRLDTRGQRAATPWWPLALPDGWCTPHTYQIVRWKRRGKEKKKINFRGFDVPLGRNSNSVPIFRPSFLFFHSTFLRNCFYFSYYYYFFKFSSLYTIYIPTITKQRKLYFEYRYSSKQGGIRFR